MTITIQISGTLQLLLVKKVKLSWTVGTRFTGIFGDFDPCVGGIYRFKCHTVSVPLVLCRLLLWNSDHLQSLPKRFFQKQDMGWLLHIFLQISRDPTMQQHKSSVLQNDQIYRTFEGFLIFISKSGKTGSFGKLCTCVMLFRGCTVIVEVVRYLPWLYVCVHTFCSV